MSAEWQNILEKLKKKLDSGTMRVWIRPLKAEIKDGDLLLFAAVPYMAKWLNDKFHSAIEECARQVLGPTAQVLIKADAKPAPPPPPKEKKETRIQSWLPVKTVSSESQRAKIWRYNFGDFVEGASNRMAVAAAKDVCRLTSDVQTLYVSAQAGLGKTHLAQAVGQDIQTTDACDRVDYMTAEEFASRYVASLRTNEAEEFKYRLRKLDVFLLEDVHFFQNKPKIQETALGIVKTIQEHGGRVIFTSSFSPKELQKVDSQLVSSFCSGILAHIDRPDFTMRCEIIRRKAHTLRMRISDTVCELLAKHLDGDIRQLQSCLSSLIFKANVVHSEITPELALEVVGYYAGIKVTDLTSLTNLVCEGYGLKLVNVYSSSRCQANVIGRNTIFYLARKYTDLTLKQIGEPFNKRHSSVLQGISSVERELARGSAIGRQMARTIALVEQRAGLS